MKYELNWKLAVGALAAGALIGLLTGNPAIGVAVFAILLFPQILSLHLRYAKYNPEHVWFKRKIYGWGWTPVTWQGWLVTIGYVGLIAMFALTIDENSPTREIMFTFLLPAVLLTVTFIRIAYMKGESPKWQWGVDENGSKK